MTYFADLEPWTYFPDAPPCCTSVGWLEAGHPYAQGHVAVDDVRAIERLAAATWQPAFARGWHACSLCGRRDEDEPLVRLIDGEHRLLGADNVFLPWGDVLYVMPTLVLHYIDAHRYRPPEAVLVAARATDPRSDEYRRECERLWRTVPT